MRQVDFEPRYGSSHSQIADASSFSARLLDAWTFGGWKRLFDKTGRNGGREPILLKNSDFQQNLKKLPTQRN
ncbi:MAG: hypothetical protein GY947_09225 [Rhodobacteraceae bacterium]|nr:hypothetical protein [Paracoccaceae bacterium]